MTLAYRSNIFGLVSNSAGTTGLGTFVTNETDPAAVLIDRIRFTADDNILKMDAAADWLAVAADAGQNGDPKGFVQHQNVKPDHFTSVNDILAQWTGPSLPSLPGFPTLPKELDVDIENFNANMNALIDKLQTSWVSHFLPGTTDTSRYDSLFTYILNGSDDTTVQNTLSNIYSDLKSALNSTLTGVNSTITKNLATMQANLDKNMALLQPMIDAAYEAALDNTADVAFARARDQAAREGARLEREAIADWAARGFALPSGVILAAQAEQREATLRASAEVAAQQAIKQQEMNVDIAKSAVESWLKVVQMQIDANLEEAKIPMEYSLRAAAMQMDVSREEAETAFKHLGLRLDFTKFAGDFALKYRVAAIEGMNNLINAYANLTGASHQFYARIADAKQRAIMALVEYYRAGLQYADMGVRVGLANTENDIRWAGVAGQFIGQAVSNYVDAAVKTASIYGGVAQAALSGLNGVVMREGAI